MKLKGRLSLTVVLLVLFLGAIIALETFHNFISGGGVGSLEFSIIPSVFIYLLSPEDGSSQAEGDIVFWYNVTGYSDVSNCTLMINHTARETNMSAITKDIVLGFVTPLSASTYNWSVRCISTAGTKFNSSFRILTIESPPSVNLRTGNQVANPVTEIISTIFVGDVAANEVKIISNIDEKTGISRIAIKTKKYVQNAKATIKFLYDKPPEIEPPKGFAYKYISISIPALSDDMLSEAEIEFFADKQWLIKNNIDRNSVRLARYNQATGWQDLTTTFSRESSTKIYYIAQTPGFSIFAILGEAQGKVAPAEVAEAPAESGGETLLGQQKVPSLYFFLPSTAALNQKAALISLITVIAIITIAGVAFVAKKFEAQEVQSLSEYITKARNSGYEIRSIKKALVNYGWHPRIIRTAVLHHRLKRIFHREKKR